MMKLVLFLQPTKDRDAVLDRRLRHEDRLEAPRQGRILFHVFTILVERRRPHAMQFAARQRGLEHIGGVHGAFCRACADQRVKLVDEYDDLAVAGRDLLQYRLQALLKFAAELGACHHGTEIQRHQSLVLQAFGDVAIDDALRQTFNDRSLAHTRFADENRVVLGAAGENLNRPTDFLVAADHRVELAAARRLGEILRVLLQRVVPCFGIGAIGRAPFAHCLHRSVQSLRCGTGVNQSLSRRALTVHGQRHQQALDGHKGIAGLLGQLFGLLKDPCQLRRQVDLPGATALHPRQAIERRLDSSQSLLGVSARRLDQVAGQTFLVIDQHLQKVLRRKALMAAAQCQTLG